MLNMVKIKQRLNAFIYDKDGAVTVDFVVITAAIVVFGAIAITILAPKVSAVMSGISVTPGVAS